MSLVSKRRRTANRKRWREGFRGTSERYQDWKSDMVIDVPDVCRIRAHLRDWERATGMVLR